MFHRHVLEFSQSPGKLTFRYCVGADMSYLLLKYPSHTPKNTGDSGWFEHLKMEGLAYIRSQNHCYIPSLDIPLVTWLSHKKTLWMLPYPTDKESPVFFFRGLPRFCRHLRMIIIPFLSWKKELRMFGWKGIRQKFKKSKSEQSKSILFDFSSSLSPFDFSTFLLPSRLSTV